MSTGTNAGPGTRTGMYSVGLVGFVHFNRSEADSPVIVMKISGPEADNPMCVIREVGVAV